MAKRQIVSAIFLLLALLLAAYTKFFWLRAHAPTPDSIARLGRKLPPLPVVDVSGKTVDAATIAVGKKSIIIFYSPACNACRLVLPALRPFPAALNLILVNEDAAGSFDVPNALKSGNVSVFKDRNRVLFRSFPMAGSPTILFVDERGILRNGLFGERARFLVQKKLREFAARP